MAKNISKVREMGPEEMEREEDALREEIWKLRLQMTTGQLQNPYRVRNARKDLARLLTVRRERELAQGGGDGR